MHFPDYSVALSSDEPHVNVRTLEDGRVAVRIEQHTGYIAIRGTVEQLLAIAVGIRDGVHVAEMEHLGHDIAVAQ